MNRLFETTTRPSAGIRLQTNGQNDPRLGDIVGTHQTDYEAAEIVIMGCPSDEGVLRSKGRPGSAKAPEYIRKQFYALTTFNIRSRIFDLGDVKIRSTLEETHDAQYEIAKQVLSDGKRLIVLGGGGDISYPDGRAMADAYGPENWIAINVDSKLDVNPEHQRNNTTHYRQLLEDNLLMPNYFYEVGFQSHFCSPNYFEFIRSLRVHHISLELLRSRAEIDTEIKEQIKLNFINHSTSLNTFFSFDMGAVRSADAPGTTDPSPLGLRAGEFIQLVKYAASLANTRIIEFSELNPEYDQDDRTAKLVAIGMHRICSSNP